MRMRLAVFVFCVAALALPAVAVAHGRAMTVALDYRLRLDPAVTRLSQIRVTILDGDRALHLSVRGNARVVVLGELGEPMLRFDEGVWVNRSSPTAQANRLVRRPGRGWKRVAGSRSYSWHENRLVPPPFEAGRSGRIAHWNIPLIVNGRRVSIGGSFLWVARPVFWPWAAAIAAAVGVAVAAMRMRRRLRRAITVVTGVLAGLAGLTAETAFSLRDAPSGNIAWIISVAVFALAAIAAWSLVVTRGAQRAYLAGTIGGGVAVFCLFWLGVFFHGAVISALSAESTRLVCSVAFAAGLTSLIGLFGVESDDLDSHDRADVLPDQLASSPVAAA
jgi:hypothetical protein